MTYRRSDGRRSRSCWARCALAAPAERRLAELLLVVRAVRSTADVDGHRRARAGRHRPGAAGHPGQRHRHGRRDGGQRRERRRGEVKENLVDGSPDSKWLVFERTGWVELELAEPVAVVRYALTSANDAPERDPRDWTLQGSDDGQTWTTLDTQTGQSFAARFQTKDVRLREHARRTRTTGSTSPRNDGDGDRPARRAAALERQDEPAARARTCAAMVGSGPRGGYNAKAGAGFTGLRALRYGGSHTAEGRALLLQQGLRRRRPRSRATTELSYVIYPRLRARRPRATRAPTRPSTWRFTDGTYLSDLSAVDQHGAELSPRGQGASKTLYTNQWNAKRSRIGAVAAGKTIDRILVAYDNPRGPARLRRLDRRHRASAGGPRARRARARRTGSITTRGTNSSGGFSRGNNIPATAVPHGFNFWTPVTNAGSLSWLYEYHRDNNADNLPTLEAFAASHEPSPWMGDRQTFQVMPSRRRRHARRGPRARALPSGTRTRSPRRTTTASRSRTA